MLESAGVTPPTTWDELAAAAQRLTSGDRFGLALSAIRTEEGVFQFLPFLWQAGGDLDTFATYGATALSFLDDLVAKGSLSEQCVGWSQQDVNTRFLNRRAAMQINGPWQSAHAQVGGLRVGRRRPAPGPGGRHLPGRGELGRDGEERARGQGVAGSGVHPATVGPGAVPGGVRRASRPARTWRTRAPGPPIRPCGSSSASCPSPVLAGTDRATPTSRRPSRRRNRPCSPVRCPPQQPRRPPPSRSTRR